MPNMLITGAASGIGRDAARRMSDRMHVVAADLDREGLDALAAEFDRDGRALSTVEVDVSRAEAGASRGSGCRGVRLPVFVIGLHGSRIQALGFRVAIDQLDHRHRRRVAVAEPRPQQPGIAARPAGVALRQGGEQLVREPGVAAESGDRLPPGVQIAGSAFAQRDQPIDQPPEYARIVPN